MPRRIGLVGCVKSKRAHATRASDLYKSSLFRGRRSWVEKTCSQWFILSARHGLVRPDARLEPYDQSLVSASRAERRVWSEKVLAALDEVFSQRLFGVTFEIHAGAAYCEFGLVDGLRRRGAKVELP